MVLKYKRLSVENEVAPATHTDVSFGDRTKRSEHCEEAVLQSLKELQTYG